MTNDTEKIKYIFNEIKSRGVINFPEYEFPSIKEDQLIVQDKNSMIFFTNGDCYDRDSKILTFNNGQIFTGEIEKKEEKCYLKDGLYTWPSGQKFEGKFLDNKFKKGNLKYGENEYKGNFNNGYFEGDGKFKFNANEFANGKFENGEINGDATVKKDNFMINGNFVESKAYGQINKCNIYLDNHTYEFENINYSNRRLVNEYIEFKKNGKKLYYIKKLEDLALEQNSNELEANEKDLSQIEFYLNLINIKAPQFEHPTIPEEGLIVKEEKYLKIKFQNGEEANMDDDNEENEHTLTIPNGEKFSGRLMLEDNKCYMRIGKYFWPSGQVYEGKFNKNNKFETTIEQGVLSINNKWSYKGRFKNGKFYDKGTIDWSDGKKLIAYFDDNKIIGHTKIEFKNNNIQADINDSLISRIQIDINGTTYKIREIDLNNNNNKPLVITKLIDENESNYFFANYRINNKQIKLEKIDKITNEELQRVLNVLDTKIIFPPFELPSINENSLVVGKEDKIPFKEGTYYDNIEEILFLQNEEKYKGKLNKSSDKYFLSNGEYTWPSGQKYLGSFNNYNIFHSENEKSTLITKDFTYEGGFENGLPNGEGEIKWKNGDIIHGKFMRGKIFGNTFVKINNVSFEGNYIYSILDGYIKNIKILDSDKQLGNNQFTIIKGKIQENIIKYDENVFEITEEDREIVPEKYYKKIEADEEDIIILFKFICKIRKLTLPIYEQPRISEDGIYIQLPNNLQKVKLAFPNDEIFNGEVQKIMNKKYMLVSGEYNWTNKQKYTGKFENNRFCDDKGELIYPDGCKYIGGFKNGLFDGFGQFINQRNDVFEGFFSEGRIKKEIKIITKNFTFGGDDIDLINKLNIKLFRINTKEHCYEISDFNINKTNIIYKRDEIEFKIEMNKELKQKIIEALLIRNKTIMKNFYYNNQYIKDLTNENTLKTLKIEDNIYSGKLTKLTIYKNRFLDENKAKKKEVKNIFAEKSIKIDIDQRLKTLKILRKKLNNNKNNNKINKKLNSINFGEIEKKEISKIFNRKMLKEMEKENELLKQDITTLKMEKELIEKEKYNKIKELQDLNLYFELIGNNYNDLINESEKKEEETQEMQQELKEIYQENLMLNKYLKKKSKNINMEEIDRKIKEFEYSNNKILNEIAEKENQINDQNKEKDELLKQIKELENNKNK